MISLLYLKRAFSLSDRGRALVVPSLAIFSGLAYCTRTTPCWSVPPPARRRRRGGCWRRPSACCRQLIPAAASPPSWWTPPMGRLWRIPQFEAAGAMIQAGGRRTLRKHRASGRPSPRRCGCAQLQAELPNNSSGCAGRSSDRSRGAQPSGAISQGHCGRGYCAHGVGWLPEQTRRIAGASPQPQNLAKYMQRVEVRMHCQGKSGPPYEFGVRWALLPPQTQPDRWCRRSGNPYDGAPSKRRLEQAAIDAEPVSEATYSVCGLPGLLRRC